MIGLLGALGGAAAVELSKLRRSRGKGDPQQVHKLKEREQQLEVRPFCSPSAAGWHNRAHVIAQSETVVCAARLTVAPPPCISHKQRIIAELEQDKKSLHQASDDKASELLNTLAAAQEEVERVKAEKASLEGEHKTLKTQATLLAVHATQLAARGNLLQQEANQLTRANKLLAEQVCWHCCCRLAGCAARATARLPCQGAPGGCTPDPCWHAAPCAHAVRAATAGAGGPAQPAGGTERSGARGFESALQPVPRWLHAPGC